MLISNNRRPIRRIDPPPVDPLLPALSPAPVPGCAANGTWFGVAEPSGSFGGTEKTGVNGTWAFGVDGGGGTTDWGGGVTGVTGAFGLVEDGFAEVESFEAGAEEGADLADEDL